MADPICRWRNSSVKQVVEFNGLFPLKTTDRVSARNLVEKRWSMIGGKDFFTTPYQLAAQMGMYYEDDINIYPRFNKLISYEEALDYMQMWGKKYYAPNPYTKSMSFAQRPVILNNFLVNWVLEHEKPLWSEALKAMFSDDVGNTDILKNMINNFTEVSIEDDKLVLKDDAPHTLYDTVFLDVDAKDKKCFFDYFGTVDSENGFPMSNSKNAYVLQQIFYGTPGSGKSFTIRERFEQDPQKVVRTTFHPDTDYATFVGCYKPITYEVNGEKKIKYDFVPQAFTDAYVKAWNDPTSLYYLILEEINRGNCAQIFGDLFQLLDRKDNGFSEYPINADVDLKDYLLYAKNNDGEDILQNKEGIKDGKLCLPPNLFIVASMNTSDQSLFPMDSAFKRRWAWEYVPIDYKNEVSGAFTITIGDKRYRWHDFLEKINERIKKVTSSEDKQMGNFFIKHSVGEKEFKDKVMFYLWSEVGKDNYQTNDAIFHCYKLGTTDKQEFSFNELYMFGSTQKLQDFMAILEVPEYVEAPDTFEAAAEELEVNGGRGKTMSLNGGDLMFKSELGFTIIEKYLSEHHELTFDQINNMFPESMMLPAKHRGVIVKSNEDLGSYARYYSHKIFNSQDGVQFRVYKQWTKENVGNVINFAKQQGWTVEQR